MIVPKGHNFYNLEKEIGQASSSWRGAMVAVKYAHPSKEGTDTHWPWSLSKKRAPSDSGHINGDQETEGEGYMGTDPSQSPSLHKHLQKETFAAVSPLHPRGHTLAAETRGKPSNVS